MIAAALRIVNPQDAEAAELQSRLEAEGPQAVLEQVCGIPRGHVLMGLIPRAYQPDEETTQ